MSVGDGVSGDGDGAEYTDGGRQWGLMPKSGSHPAVERRPIVHSRPGMTFICCPCRINAQDSFDVFWAMVTVQDAEWVVGLVRASEAGFMFPG